MEKKTMLFLIFIISVFSINALIKDMTVDGDLKINGGKIYLGERGDWALYIEQDNDTTTKLNIGQFGITTDGTLQGVKVIELQSGIPIIRSIVAALQIRGDVDFQYDTGNGDSVRFWGGTTGLQGIITGGYFNPTSGLKVNGTQVVGEKIINAQLAGTINSGDSVTNVIIGALRSALSNHGLAHSE